jgi:hypothetical protein
VVIAMILAASELTSLLSRLMIRTYVFSQTVAGMAETVIVSSAA